MENENTLSGSQKLVRFFSSKSKFEKIKAESKLWKFTCDCGKESSIWEIGGVRSGAKGKPSMYIKCPACGKGGMKKIEKV
ncbi:MAG: hypothetical protein A2W91_20070 [Bacteroidetes bacterium GWF2_38_335]|nr:MAG: hypothetical protein A2W91_20070 [Bacteroidetes bacterium GWF2_38_335]OFY81984.1 MAG: hypothetical protein A2281_09850 [Bacteroidetes bacterium RIFOXYA12_FULL_38_20]HBS86517.1 hypothetical protein [Bacteroidales bacterium]